MLLADKSDAELVDVLAGPSRKLGDTAGELLGRRKRLDLVAAALRDQRITRREGKVRALNLLLREGRHMPEAFSIYLQYACDRSNDVASCALFGLAFWQDEAVIPFLESLLDSKNSEQVRKAIDALRSGDPKRYSEGFYDSLGVWKNG